MSDDQREAWYAAQQQGAPKGVKILKRGSLPEKQVFRADCGHCGTQIEFEQGAARYSSDQRDGNMLIIACPVCNRDLYVNPDRKQP